MPELFEALSDTYDIVAELHAREDAQTYMGTRRDDGARVLIHVVRTPKGDEGNALTHFAADSNLLARLRHRNLIGVLESRWLNADTLAVITERVVAPDLQEVLARGEDLSYPRTASILREVNGLLEWARTQGVVHRAIDATTLFLEPGSDRVLASFIVTAIPLTGVPGGEGDARTIAMLARTMLTRDTEISERAEQPLAELRPDLPDEIVQQTEALLHPSPAADEVPDVRGYIATIAMADALTVGEDETARVAAHLLQEERETRRQLDAERAEFEQTVTERRRQLAAERAEFEQTVAEQRRQLAEEREALERREARIAGYEKRIEERLRELELHENALTLAATGQFAHSTPEPGPALNDVQAAALAELSRESAAFAARTSQSVGDKSDPAPSSLNDLSPRARRVILGATLGLVALTLASAAVLARRVGAPDDDRAALRPTRGAAHVDSVAGRVVAGATAIAESASTESRSPVPSAATAPATDAAPRVARTAPRRLRVQRDAAPADTVQMPMDPVVGPPLPPTPRNAPRVDSILRAVPLRPRITPSAGTTTRPDSTPRDTTARPRPDSLTRTAGGAGY